MTDQRAPQAQPPAARGGGLANDTDAGTLLVSTSASIAHPPQNATQPPPSCQEPNLSAGDPQAATWPALLAHLHRGGTWGYYWTKPGKVSHWWPVGDPGTVPSGALDVYFGVHPGNREKGTNERAMIGDVAAVNCLFADLDAKHCGGDKAGALVHLDALDPAPSVVIDSGGGYHAYWLLLEPYALTTDTKRERAREVQARWVAHVGGDPGAKDLARVLRVPGTRNLKPEYGPDFPTVEVIRADFSRLYDLDALEALLPQETPQETQPPAQVAPRSAQDDGRDRWAEAAFSQELATLARARAGERNDTLNQVAFSLGQIVAGGRLDRGEVEQALAAAALAIGLGETETRDTIRSGIEAGMNEPRGPKDAPKGKRQKARKLGARVPSEEAQAIKAMAPEPPDPDLRRQIIDALLGWDVGEDDEKPPVLIRRQRAGRLLLDWLGGNGGFVQSEAGERFYFYRPGRRLYNLDSDRWAAWLYAVSGANPAGTDYAHLVADCKAAAIDAPRRAIVRVSAWDDAAQVLRVSRFDGTVYVLNGAAIQEEANGENVLFDDASTWTPYAPALDGSGGALHWHTAELPNWTPQEDLDAGAYGLAFRAWVVGSFFTELCPTRPMLVMIGEKGSGKTCTLRLLLRFLFGPLAEVSGVPDKADGFTAAAAAAHVLVLDNLDTFRGWLRDKLARLSTGGVDEYRRLYTSNDVGRVRYRTWLAFTSRTPDTLRRDDLADRLLLLPVERLGPEVLQAERDFLAQATHYRGEWWGDVLRTLNQVVAAIRAGQLRSKSSLRMADWESLGRLVAETEGALDLWERWVEDLGKAQAAFLLEGDLVVEGLTAWMENSANQGREMTANTLHQELTALLFDDRKPPSDWPKSAIGFGRRLAGIRRELRTMWRVDWGQGTTAKTRSRTVYQFWPTGAGQEGLELGEITF